MKLHSFIAIFMSATVRISCSANDFLDCKTSPTSTIIDLKNAIFQNCKFDSSMRPIPSDGITTNVYFNIAVQFIDYYEHYNTLYIHSWVPMHWMDQRLKWEPSKFSDQSFLHIDFDAIWIPDIMVYTASDMRESSPLSSSEMKCITYSDGTVTCVPSIAFSAKCVSDVRRWPYDVQNCSMRIGSQTYSGQDLDIHTINAHPLMDNYQVNNDWELLSVEVTKHVRPYQNSSYPWLNYSFVIKRHSQGHSAIVIIPALLMALLTLTSFWLEPDCVERVAFCCMIIISHFLYTTYIPIMVPANGNESPLIVLFFRDSLILVTISLVTAVIVKGLSSASMSPPDWVSDPSYRVIHSVIGHWVLPSELRSKGNLTAEEADEDVNSLETTTHKKMESPSNHR